MDFAVLSGGGTPLVGWSDPDVATLDAAMEAVDAMLDGSRLPATAIEDGIRIHLLMRCEEGADASTERAGLVMAVARVMELDGEAPKARVGSLAAARMVSLDASLQRDADGFADRDVLDRDVVLDPRETAARGVDWREMAAVASCLLFEDRDGLRAIAEGEPFGASLRTSAAHRASIDGARMPTFSEMDARLMVAAGLMTPREAASMVGAVGRERTGAERDVFIQGLRLSWRRDEARFGSGGGEGREAEHETALIARRTARMIQEVSHHPLRQGPADVVARVVADAAYPEPEHGVGRAVRAAGLRLEAAGASDPFASDAMRLAVGRAIGPEGDLAHGPRELEERVVMDVVLQLEAGRLARAIAARRDAVAAGDRHPPEVVLRGPLSTLGGRMVATVLGSSLRDLPDLECLAAGDHASLSNGTGMAHGVRHAIEDAAARGRVLDRREREPSLLDQAREAAARAPRADPASSAVPMGKGAVEGGSDWIDAIAAAARRNGRSAG